MKLSTGPAWLRLAAVSLLALAGATVQAATLRIATLAPDGTAWMREMRAGADAVKQKTDGRVEIKYFPGGVMGDSQTVLRKVKVGQLQGGAFTAGELSEVAKDVQIYSLPFLFRNLEEVDRVRAQLDDAVEASIRAAGFEPLGISGGGFAYLMSTRDLKSRDDLKAAKVWIPQGDKIAELAFRTAGITPIPLALSDVYTSLQTGLIDSAANTTAGAIAFQWHTKLKYMVDLPLSYVTGMLVVDNKSWGKIDEADRAIVSVEFAAVFKRLDAQNRLDNAAALDALKQAGMTINQPVAADGKSWESLGAESYQELIRQGGITPDMQKKLEAALASIRGGSR